MGPIKTMGTQRTSIHLCCDTYGTVNGATASQNVAVRQSVDPRSVIPSLRLLVSDVIIIYDHGTHAQISSLSDPLV